MKNTDSICTRKYRLLSSLVVGRGNALVLTWHSAAPGAPPAPLYCPSKSPTLPILTLEMFSGVFDQFSWQSSSFRRLTGCLWGEQGLRSTCVPTLLSYPWHYLKLSFNTCENVKTHTDLRDKSVCMSSIWWILHKCTLHINCDQKWWISSAGCGEWRGHDSMVIKTLWTWVNFPSWKQGDSILMAYSRRVSIAYKLNMATI